MPTDLGYFHWSCIIDARGEITIEMAFKSILISFAIYKGFSFMDYWGISFFLSQYQEYFG